MKPILLFANPKAGRGAARRVLPRIVRALADAGVRIDTRISDTPGGLEPAVHDAVRRDRGRIVIAGGDGSFHDAVNGLLRAGGERIGLLPLGTGNDFAKSAGIAADPVAAARALATRLHDGTTLGRFDAGVCNGRYFHNGAGIGLDARIARIAASVRLPIGNLVYVWGIARALLGGIATPPLTIHADDALLWRGPATLANVANGRWVGGRFLIAPAAELSDGRLDLVIASALTRRRILSLLPRLLDGRHVDAPEVVTCRVRSLRVHCRSPVVAHLDGEIQPAAKRFDIACAAAAVELL